MRSLRALLNSDRCFAIHLVVPESADLAHKLDSAVMNTPEARKDLWLRVTTSDACCGKPSCKSENETKQTNNNKKSKEIKKEEEKQLKKRNARKKSVPTRFIFALLLTCPCIHPPFIIDNRKHFDQGGLE